MQLNLTFSSGNDTNTLDCPTEQISVEEAISTDNDLGLNVRLLLPLHVLASSAVTPRASTHARAQSHTHALTLSLTHSLTRSLARSLAY